MKRKLLFLMIFASVIPALQAATIKISYKDLLREYEDNALLANEKFKNQRLIVTGAVNKIAQDDNGDRYAELGSYLTAGGSVKCYFDKSESQALLGLKKGVSVSIEGTCQGKEYSVVQLKKCTIVSNSPEKNSGTMPSEKNMLASLVTIEGEKGKGSGFITSFQGKKVIVTNIHVLFKNQKIKLLDTNNNVLKIKGIYFAKDRDIAIMPLLDQDIPALQMENDITATPRNSSIVVYGNSMGSGINTELHGIFQGYGPKIIEISSQIVPGNSGSPVISKTSGKVIGVATYATYQPRNILTADSRFAAIRRFGTRIDNLTLKDIQRISFKKYKYDLQRYDRLSQANEIAHHLMGRGGFGKLNENDFSQYPDFKVYINLWNNALEGRGSLKNALFRMTKYISIPASICKRYKSEYSYLNKLTEDAVEYNSKAVKTISEREKDAEAIDERNRNIMTRQGRGL